LRFCLCENDLLGGLFAFLLSALCGNDCAKNLIAEEEWGKGRKEGLNNDEQCHKLNPIKICQKEMKKLTIFLPCPFAHFQGICTKNEF
jgi:hypothetical protein